MTPTDTTAGPVAQGFLSELEREAPVTRRFLERIPADRLSWRPHAKSLTSGQLGLHLAALPGNIAEGSRATPFVFPPESAMFPQPDDLDEILRAHDDGLARAREILAETTDVEMQLEWRGVAGDEVVAAMPRQMLFRFVLFNHLCHHRGQLGVHLRLLGAAVPSAYGPSGDEAP